MSRWQVVFDSAGREVWGSDGGPRQRIAGFADEAARRQLQDKFRAWAEAYRAALEAPNPREAMFTVGREIGAWIDAGSGWVDRGRKSVETPLMVEFSVLSLDEDELAAAFLDAPWELAAHHAGFWALDEHLIYCPIRRIGAAADPLPPSPRRLMVVFMAAAPRGQENLRYEAEEAAFVRATSRVGLDLIVEDTGTLAELAERVAHFQPVDVVHISCHGKLKPEPRLLLEDRFGDPDFVEATRLAAELDGVKRPRLLTLSACETAQADEVIGSAARSLVRRSVPAVLGWGGSVHDDQATIFAAALYKSLAERQSLEHAVAWARFQLHVQMARRQSPTDYRNDWHMARLFVGPKGGGVLAEGGPTRFRAISATKEFLDAKGDRKVSVATEFEFVGRRRPLQTVLREFYQPARHGLLIHGVGRLGKSSLAARVAHRMDRLRATGNGQVPAVAAAAWRLLSDLNPRRAP